MWSQFMHSLAEFTLPASNRAASARFWGVNSNKTILFTGIRTANSISRSQEMNLLAKTTFVACNCAVNAQLQGQEQ
jgi:hypothetical protein